MNETENDDKTFDERVEQFKERIRQCKTADEILYTMADAPGDTAAIRCIAEFDVIKEQLNKVMSTGA